MAVDGNPGGIAEGGAHLAQHRAAEAAADAIAQGGAQVHGGAHAVVEVFFADHKGGDQVALALQGHQLALQHHAAQLDANPGFLIGFDGDQDRRVGGGNFLAIDADVSQGGHGHGGALAGAHIQHHGAGDLNEQHVAELGHFAADLAAVGRHERGGVSRGRAGEHRAGQQAGEEQGAELAFHGSQSRKAWWSTGLVFFESSSGSMIAINAGCDLAHSC